MISLYIYFRRGREREKERERDMAKDIAELTRI